MPQLRKLLPAEVQQVEDDQQATQRALEAAAPLADRHARKQPPPSRSVHRTPPLIGDIVDLPGRQNGIVLQIRRAQNGTWDVAEVLVNRQRRWMRADQVGATLGRPSGISRIDHPRKRTYGWYVRTYDGRHARVSRFFSDLKCGGRAAALVAALTYLDTVNNTDNGRPRDVPMA